MPHDSFETEIDIDIDNKNRQFIVVSLNFTCCKMFVHLSKPLR